MNGNLSKSQLISDRLLCSHPSFTNSSALTPPAHNPHKGAYSLAKRILKTKQNKNNSFNICSDWYARAFIFLCSFLGKAVHLGFVRQAERF